MTNEELAALPTTNHRYWIATRLLLATAVVALGAFVHAIATHADAMALTILEMWLWFLGAALGINVAQYGVKRFSDSGYAAAKASGAPAQVVTSAGGTVVASAPPSSTTVTDGEAGGVTVASSPTPEPRSGDSRTRPPAPTGPVEPNLYHDDERGDG